MRIWPFLIVLSLSFTSGCSIMIASCGKDLSVVETQEQVHKDYGEPVASGVEDGRRFEDFRSHRKVVDETEVAGLSLGSPMLIFGLAEFWCFPWQVHRAVKATLVGQSLRFYYDDSGKVEDVKLNGDTLRFRRKVRQSWNKPFVENERPVEEEPYRKLGLIDPDTPGAATTPEVKP